MSGFATPAFELYNDASDILEFVAYRDRLVITCTDEFRQRCIAMVEMPADKARLALLSLAAGKSPVQFQGSERFGGDYVEYEITERAQEFTVHRSGSRRALRRFRAEWSFDVKGRVKQILAELPAPQPQPARAPDPPPVVKPQAANQDDPRDARIRELEKENGELRALVAFLNQYRPIKET